MNDINIDNLAPVAVFAYNRLDKIKACIEALGRCDLARHTEVFIFADGYKSEKDREQVEAVHSWLQDFSQGTVRDDISYSVSVNDFKNVSLEIKAQNAGLASSIITGVTSLMNNYGHAIVVEDDLIVSPVFLRYMNEGLNFYKDSENIWAIASYGYELKALNHYDHDVYMGYRASSWGWASWKDRWDTVDWDVSDYNKLVNSPDLQKLFCRGGGDLYPMLQRQMRGESDSWAIRWNYAASRQDKLTVYPKYGLSSNSGFDGSGTHSGLKGPEESLKKDLKKVKFEHLPLDKRITREFYLLHTDTLDKKIKRNASLKGIIKILKRILTRSK